MCDTEHLHLDLHSPLESCIMESSARERKQKKDPHQLITTKKIFIATPAARVLKPTPAGVLPQDP